MSHLSPGRDESEYPKEAIRASARRHRGRYHAIMACVQFTIPIKQAIKGRGEITNLIANMIVDFAIFISMGWLGCRSVGYLRQSYEPADWIPENYGSRFPNTEQTCGWGVLIAVVDKMIVQSFPFLTIVVATHFLSKSYQPPFCFGSFVGHSAFNFDTVPQPFVSTKGSRNREPDISFVPRFLIFCMIRREITLRRNPKFEIFKIKNYRGSQTGNDGLGIRHLDPVRWLNDRKIWTRPVDKVTCEP